MGQSSDKERRESPKASGGLMENGNEKAQQTRKAQQEGQRDNT